MLITILIAFGLMLTGVVIGQSFTSWGIKTAIRKQGYYDFDEYVRLVGKLEIKEKE